MVQGVTDKANGEGLGEGEEGSGVGGAFVLCINNPVQVVKMISLDEMHSENVCSSRSKPSNYQEKLRCHAFDERTDKRRKVENRAVFL